MIVSLSTGSKQQANLNGFGDDQNHANDAGRDIDSEYIVDVVSGCPQALLGISITQAECLAPQCSSATAFLLSDRYTHIVPLCAPNGDPLRALSATQHFYDKLIHVKGRLKTEPGRGMGQKRHEPAGAHLAEFSPWFRIL